jgi:predicted nucleotide-binding protein (sugar kinase/HSP70/actin superfamily)
MRDLSELTVLAKGNPAAAKALEEHYEFAMPVLIVDVEHGSAGVARKGVIRVKLNEALMAHLVALRANQRKDFCA